LKSLLTIHALGTISPDMAKTLLTQVDSFGWSCVFNCGALVLAAPCIAAAVAAEGITLGASTAAVLACGAGGANQVCVSLSSVQPLAVTSGACVKLFKS
jgi:hypothetical protein